MTGHLMKVLDERTAEAGGGLTSRYRANPPMALLAVPELSA